MAPNHMSSEQNPLQGQTAYPDPTYDHLFHRVNQYARTPSWDQFNSAQSTIPQSSGNQSWHQNPIPQQAVPQHGIPQQTYSPVAQHYGVANHASHGNSAHANQSHGYQPTPSYQYQQYNNSHGPGSNYGHHAAVDPSLQDSMGARQQQQQQQQHQSPYQHALRTVSPHALQQNSTALPNVRSTSAPYQLPKTTAEVFAQRAASTSLPNPLVSKVNYEVPKGKMFGSFSVIDPLALAKATNSKAVNKNVYLGTEPMHLATNRTALPTYNPRQSVKDLRLSGPGSKKLLDNRKPSSRKMLLSKPAGNRLAAGGPSALQRDVSETSSDYSDSSDDSEYTDDEDDEPSPLPASRPEDPTQAVQYDVIKSTWCPRRSQPSPEKIKTSLSELWEIVNTIQKRWRADSKAVQEATEKKKAAELPVLNSRVTGQRDLLQCALRSAIEYGHPDVLFHLGKAKSFLYLCYQFLANRIKMEDYDGGLSSVILEVLARASGTLTTELIEETKLIKALNVMMKKANEANKALIQQIIDGASAGSKKPKVSSPPRDDAAEPKAAKRPATVVSRPSSEGPMAKKPKTVEPTAGIPKKPLPVSTGAKAVPASNQVPQKRPGEKPTTAPLKPRGTQVVNKPSAFFSTLNAASKKPAPTTQPTLNSKPNTQQKPTPATAAKDKKPASKPAFSFAELMAQTMEPKKEVAATPKPEKQLPPETAEEKTKRLRKESRRHMRVSFRPDASLVDIRYFSHDPEEEERQDENFVLDAGDIGGEGRMFKQHRDMVEDEDDEDEPEQTYRPWKECSTVNFDFVDPEERARNYEPYGGGMLKPVCPEAKANQLRENETLMVVYAHPSDIPTSPREPADLETASQPSKPATEFGLPPRDILDRAPKQQAPAAAVAAAVPAAVPNVDTSLLESIVAQLAGNTKPGQPPVGQSAYVPPHPAPPPAPAMNSTNLSAILSALQSQTNQPQPQTPASTIPPVPQALPGVDLNAIFSSLQQGGLSGPGFPPPPLPWGQYAPPFPLPQQQAQVEPVYQPQQQSQFNAQANTNTKRQREEGSNSAERGYGSFKKQKNHKNPNPYNGERPHKVVPCKFFQQGKCSKGDDCTFIHERS